MWLMPTSRGFPGASASAIVAPSVCVPPSRPPPHAPPPSPRQGSRAGEGGGASRREGNAGMPDIFLDDLAPGQTYDLGRRRVSREEILAFAKEYDPQPFHVDEAAAAASIYG